MQPTLHRCPDCGLFHGSDGGGYAPEPAAHPEVEIARINADRDIKIAQMGARTEREVTQTTVEAAGEVAEVEAVTAVMVAEAQAEAAPVVEVLPEPVPEPEVIDQAEMLDDGGFAPEDEDIAPAPEPVTAEPAERKRRTWFD